MSILSRVGGAGITAYSVAANGNARASLIPESLGFPVVFSFNPESVSVSKQSITEGSRGTNDANNQSSVRATSNTTISLKQAHVTGLGATQSAIDRILEWTTPVSTPNLAGIASNLAQSASSMLDSASSVVRNGLKPFSTAPTQSTTRGTNSVGSALTGGVSTTIDKPVLLFVWGVGGPAGAGAKVIIDKASITINRFHWTGIPVWAQFNLDLVIVKPPWPFTNPTSGGVSGRYKHVMTAGESVVGVATGTYGTPSAWRAVAEANGLDDPLRVRPGSILTLPAAGELAAS